MACHVLRLDVAAECGSCSRLAGPGRVVITDQIEPPVYVVACPECAPGLDGAELAIRVRDRAPALSP